MKSKPTVPVVKKKKKLSVMASLKKYAAMIVAVDLASYKLFILQESADKESIVEKAKEKIDKRNDALKEYFQSVLKPTLRFTMDEYGILDDMVEDCIKQTEGVDYESVYAEDEKKNFLQGGCWYHINS